MEELRDDKKYSRSNEERIQLNQLGCDWLQAFFSIIRTSQIHKPANQIFDEPIRILISKAKEILETESSVDFRIIEEQFFLNGLWIKPKLSEKENIFSLVDYLLEKGIGGIVLRSETSDENWRKFLSIYQTFSGAKEDIVGFVNGALGEQGIEHIEVRKAVYLVDETPEERPLPIIPYAGLQIYAKALFVLQNFVTASPGEEQVEALRRAQRTICEFVDLADEALQLFLLLSLLKYMNSYFYHHSVNVLVLSLALARQIGFGRRELVDLGMASLFHDIGKLEIPKEVLSKSTKLTEEERNLIERHPIESAKKFLTLGYFNQSVAERAIVGYQHHLVSGRSDAYPKPRREMEKNLFSSIVGVCVLYDALITEKSFRAAVLPYQAIRILWSQGEKGLYEADIVAAFIRMMGPLPIGSWVTLSDGREGIIAAAGKISPCSPFPLIHILTEAGPQWVNLQKEREENQISISPKEMNPKLYFQSLSSIFRSGEGVVF